MKNSLFKKLLLSGIFLAFGFVKAQNISGTVSDANGPLPGANVLVKGTTTGTTTDFDGNYTLSNVPSDGVLVFSYIGFMDQEIAVDGRSVIDVTLRENLQSLDEVIVVAYGTSTQRDLTGSVGVVSGEELNQFPAVTIDQALQGSTPGIQIMSNSGAPGASVAVTIRGASSFANTTPLYVVDGYPTQNISYLNPNNIESISVLKDASASAIYGVRAANGVVIIETKKGTKGRVDIEIDSWAGFRSEPDFLEVLDAQTFASFAQELTTVYNATQDDPNFQIVNTYYPGWDNPESLTNVNWQEFAFRPGFRTGTNITVRGGGEKTRVAFTAGLLQDEGSVVGSSYDRYNIGLNAQFDITDDFRATADIKYAYSENVVKLNPGYYNILKLVGNIPHLESPGVVNLEGGVNPTNLPYDGNGNYGSYPDVPNQAFRSNTNVIGSALATDVDNGNNNILANMSLAYDFWGGFTAKVNLGGNINVSSNNFFNPEYYRSLNNVDVNSPASYDVSNDLNNEVLAEGILQYNREFGKHNVDVLGGISTQRDYYKRLRNRSQIFLNNSIRDIAQGLEVTNVEGFVARSTLSSLFGRINYDYDNKYYLTATIRRDGNGSKFGDNKLWGVFPAFSAGWNLDQESFMEDSPFDLFKLRGSWGESGNFFGIADFQFLTIFSAGGGSDNANYDFGGVAYSGLFPENLPNDNLSWETLIHTNVGLDIALFDNKLYFTGEWFKKESSDFLFDESIPVQNGFTTRAVNAGSLENTGFEFILGYREYEGDFNLDISANLTFLKNEITSLTKSQNYQLFDSAYIPTFAGGNFWSGVSRSIVGGEVGTFYGFRSDGIFQTQEEIDELNAAALANPDNGAEFYQGRFTAPGDRKFKDLNGDDRVDDEDREILGSANPDFFGSLNLNFTYKNWDLGINLYGQYGNEIMNFVRVEMETAGGYGLGDAFTNVGVEYYNNYWRPDRPSNTYARAIADDGINNNGRVSDYFMEDGSFMKLRNVRLAYNIPGDLVQKIGMNSARVYVSAQNLLTWTSYSGWDPEIGQNFSLLDGGSSSVSSRGIDSGAYPVTGSFTFGVNLQF